MSENKDINFKEIEEMDEFNLLEAMENIKPEIVELTEEEEQLIQEYEDLQYKKMQEEMDNEFEDNLNIESFNIQDLEEFDPTNSKYYY